MAEKIQAPRGTFDVLPEDGVRRLALLQQCEDLFERRGYQPIETPIFESTDLFARGVGETTDIVEKEMFTFDDQGGRSITLRPEGTASVCRAYIEHGMQKWAQPVKLWYWGPFFRYEAPQAGRYRQFAQVGAEALGSDDPSLDAEVIVLLAKVIAAAGVKQVRLRVSSLGTPETRRAYSDELRDFLRAREDQLSDDVRARLDRNPLRAFDADHEGTRAALRDAPRLLDRLDAADAEHFDEVRRRLDEAGQPYEVDGTLVRGLDYYTRTVFEFTSDALGAQSGVGGGGRYDLLVEQLGGPPTPGVGWAAGIERILLASERAQPVRRRPLVFVALLDGADAREAFAFTERLRDRHAVEIEQAGRSAKGQLKHAARLGAEVVVKITGDGMSVRDMDSGEEQDVNGQEEAFALVDEWVRR